MYINVCMYLYNVFHFMLIVYCLTRLVLNWMNKPN